MSGAIFAAVAADLQSLDGIPATLGALAAHLASLLDDGPSASLAVVLAKELRFILDAIKTQAGHGDDELAATLATSMRANKNTPHADHMDRSTASIALRDYLLAFA